MIRVATRETRVFPLAKSCLSDSPATKSMLRVAAVLNGLTPPVTRLPEPWGRLQYEDYTVPSIPHERKSNRHKADRR